MTGGGTSPEEDHFQGTTQDTNIKTWGQIGSELEVVDHTVATDTNLKGHSDGGHIRSRGSKAHQCFQILCLYRLVNISYIRYVNMLARP